MTRLLAVTDADYDWLCVNAWELNSMSPSEYLHHCIQFLRIDQIMEEKGLNEDRQKDEGNKTRN